MTAKADVPLITKMMSMTFNDFSRGIAVLAGENSNVKPSREHNVLLPLGHGHVEIEFIELADARLGGLLQLPRARVTLRFSDVGPAEARQFLKRFDLAFQRGGG